jgi:ABC-2 type transport system permease protein
MLATLSRAFIYELKSISNSYYKLLLITILPLFSFWLIISIFEDGVAREIPLAVVDNDRSQLSRMVIYNVDASPTMKVDRVLDSTKEAISMLKHGRVYGVVVIPSHFYRDTILHKKPQITAMLNTQYILIGKIVTSALSSTIMTTSGYLEYMEKLAKLQNPNSAKVAVAPIGMQVTPFFNTYQNYSYFLVSALIPAIWQIFIVIATIVSIGVIFKTHKIREFFKDSRYIPIKLIALQLPYTISYTLIGVLYLLYIYSSWEFQGSFGMVVVAIFSTVVAYQSIALFIFTLGFEYTRSLSIGAVYTAPAFAFLGVTFPIYNMNEFALFWRSILPISHYMEIVISQANYGADIALDIDKLGTIYAFWLLLIPVFWLFRYRVEKELR